jgi:hypothetical protein
MKQYCYVIMNNAGHSWLALGPGEPAEAKESNVPVLAQLLGDGWVPIRETPMGGGTSHLAHSLVLLERAPKPERATKPERPPKPERATKRRGKSS